MKIPQSFSPLDSKLNLRGKIPQWLRPVMIAEITYADWTENKRLRQPAFKGLRNDKVTQALSVKTGGDPAADTYQQGNALEIDGLQVPVTSSITISKYRLICGPNSRTGPSVSTAMQMGLIRRAFTKRSHHLAIPNGSRPFPFIPHPQVRTSIIYFAKMKRSLTIWQIWRASKSIPGMPKGIV